jgi:hypothetical protein
MGYSQPVTYTVPVNLPSHCVSSHLQLQFSWFQGCDLMKSLHGNLPGHGSVKACGDRMLQSPGDADRSAVGMTDVLATTEEVVRC